MARIRTYRGTSGSDLRYGTRRDERMFGYGGADRLFGGAGNDTLYGGDGADQLSGDFGNDALWGGKGRDTLSGGLGDDVLQGGGGDDLLVAGDGYDRLAGGAGDDVMQSGAGTKLFEGGAGIDLLDYRGFTTSIEVVMELGYVDKGTGLDSLANDVEGVFGSQASDVLRAGFADTYLDGYFGDDVLIGLIMDDTLIGGLGDDRLTGGLGSDRMTGGAGADVFVYVDDLDVGPSPTDTDVITDFSAADGDRIDLSAIKADRTVPGDQAFTFIGTAAFSGVAGELRYEFRDGVTVLEGDVDGDGGANGCIVLDGEIALTAADFIL